MADPTNKVPFPFLGDANNPAVLRFRTADLVALEEKYGIDFTTEVPNLLMANSSACMVFCLRSGLKDLSGRKPFKAVDYDDLPFGVQEAASDILDAISLAITGRSYAELIEARQTQNDATGPRPDLGQAGSSNESSGSDTPAVS